MYSIGAKVMAQWSDGAWYPATITQVGQGQFFVTYDDGYTAWLGPHQLQPAGGGAATPGAFAVGMRVRSEYEGSWYSGTIKQMGDGQYLVHYDDGDSAWKAAHELQPEAPTGGGKGMPMGGGKAMPMGGGKAMAMAGGAWSVGTKVSAQWSDGAWYPATVTQVGQGQVFVTYDDGYTAWLGPHQIRPAGGGLGVGARVLGQWANGAWYPGTITQDGGEAFFVQFDDGDTAWLASHQIKPA